MVSALLRSTILAIAAQLALGSPMGAAPSLKVEVSSTSVRVASVQDLKIAASVTNTGAEAVKLLKYGTVLDDKLPTRSFAVSSKDGKAVPFTGIKVQVSLTKADDSAFVHLAPGESVSTTHDVAALYDFSKAGAGSFDFAPLTDFIVVDTDAAGSTAKYVENGRQFSRIEASSVNSNTVSIEVTSDVAKRDLESGLQKRASVVCSDSTKNSFIKSSYTEAKTLASTASSYVSSKGASDTLYTSYWGANDVSSVTSVLDAVAGESSSSRTLSCTDALNACSGGVIAYTATSTTNVYFCDIFFDEVATTELCSGTTVAARNIRGGTTLHELTHALSGTDDVTYGCSADQALTDDKKIINADNFNCFTTQVYADTKC
ncbi:Metalloprotease [Ephemerocybe angulata]|uniref:deuterolysin n=1 Tax=Ephemerocybe angulata TaxID=980116 RepID=A0A8H6M0N6_9AGAR|nr:Metalloprotease [Tulosesus angulatus]